MPGTAGAATARVARADAGGRRRVRFRVNAARRDTGIVSVREDCRHYSTRSTPTGDVLQRCRLSMAEEMPFACPEDCLFFEPRSITDTGWSRLDPND